MSRPVGIVPEMLPAVVNANLARGSFRLAKQGALVKSLGAVQNLGSMSVLCSDKTGTLTRDETRLCRAEDCDGQDSERVLALAYTNALFQAGRSNVVDAAILRREVSKSKMEAGVKVLTGDSLRIASKVCHTLGITSGEVESGLGTVTGPELAGLSADDIHRRVQTIAVFAKLTPKQKGDVVLALQKAGKAVGMLGDGINDCPALRAADVGISVHNAVPVAKVCADVILTRKALGLVLDGVRAGRTTHGNTVKYIKMVAKLLGLGRPVATFWGFLVAELVVYCGGGAGGEVGVCEGVWAVVVRARTEVVGRGMDGM